METATFDLDTSRLDYAALRGSEAYEAYVDLSSRLRRFDLRQLNSRADRLCFWINVFNCLIIHGIIALGIEESVKEVRGFFRRIAYNIGGWRFSPDDIEHGILRGNTRHPFGLKRPFHPWDDRRAFAVEPRDPRIHFALVCGASSCPPVGAYSPSKVEDQLTFAAEAFINDPSRVLIEPTKESVRLSQIFQWYAKDFGATHKAVLTYLLDYLDPNPARDWLEANLDSAAIHYIPYNWSLNTSK
ncbi:DUF547 domain-containing protein [Nitrospinae bacterium AH_259_B05_G02_I21]|nr:DUF547 domain-containing protein [Nitrospinae bacterium AH_259_B05_G02_I21]